MIKNLNATGLYSIEHENLYKEVMKNKKVNINIIDKKTIKEIDKYLEKIKGLDRDVLEESVNKRISDIELDLGSFIGTTVGLASLEVAVIPVFLKYSMNSFIESVMIALEVIIAILMVVLVLKVTTFYFRRKEELMFNKLVLSRVKKVYKS